MRWLQKRWLWILLVSLCAQADPGVTLKDLGSIERALGLQNYPFRPTLKPIEVAILDDGFGSKQQIQKYFPDARILDLKLINGEAAKRNEHGLDGAHVIKALAGSDVKLHFLNDRNIADGGSGLQRAKAYIQDWNNQHNGNIVLLMDTRNLEYGSNWDGNGYINRVWSDIIDSTGVIGIVSAGNYGGRVWEGEIEMKAGDDLVYFDGKPCLYLKNHPAENRVSIKVNWNKNSSVYGNGTKYDLDAVLWKLPKGAAPQKIAESKLVQAVDPKDGQYFLASEIIDAPLATATPVPPPPAPAPSASGTAVPPTPGTATTATALSGPPDLNAAPPAKFAQPVSGTIADLKPQLDEPQDVTPVLLLEEETDYCVQVENRSKNFKPSDRIRVTVLTYNDAPTVDPKTQKLIWSTEIMAPVERLNKSRSVMDPGSSSDVITVGADVPYSSSDRKLGKPDVIMPAFTTNIRMNNNKVLDGVTTSTRIFTAVVARLLSYRSDFNRDVILDWNKNRPYNADGIKTITLEELTRQNSRFRTIYDSFNTLVKQNPQITEKVLLPAQFPDGHYGLATLFPEQYRIFFKNLPEDAFVPNYRLFLRTVPQTTVVIERDRYSQRTSSSQSNSQVEAYAKLVPKGELDVQADDPINDLEVRPAWSTKGKRVWITPTPDQMADWKVLNR